MRVIPAGKTFIGDETAAPRHEVTISHDFAVGVYEVMRSEFGAFIKATKYDAGNSCFGHEGGKWQEIAGRNWSDPGFPQTDREPVVCVSWNDAKAYVQWLAQKTGKPYRLITESEWEYVARAGRDPDSIPTHDEANYGAEAHCCTPLVEGKDRWVYTAPVGSFPADALGLHDVFGNVWEILEDCYNNSYEGSPTDGTARTTNCSMPDRRAVRGGGWADPPRLLRVAYRLRTPLATRYFTLGLRVARTINER